MTYVIEKIEYYSDAVAEIVLLVLTKSSRCLNSEKRREIYDMNLRRTLLTVFLPPVDKRTNSFEKISRLAKGNQEFLGILG
ncbi:MAG: hypothetical protein KAT16_08260, partial [Candidatus Heimdallarchaeota archaeon]|nr:hypothetical protein [Candidatus Heimdallarchaeota archaeon]